MSVSRLTALPFALAVFTLTTSATARAQTTAPAPATTAAAVPASTVAQQSAPASDADVRIKQLEDRIATLEKAEAKNRTTAAAAPVVSATRDGLVVRSADNTFGFRLRGYVQSDARFFGAAGPVAP